MRNIAKHSDYYIYKELLKEAFKRLRRQGIYARMNFSCCTSCASYELHQKLRDNNKKIGFVYWHRQNEEAFQRSGFVHLGFDSKDDSIEKQKEIGSIVFNLLKSMNIPCEWNGDANQKIAVGKLV